MNPAYSTLLSLALMFVMVISYFCGRGVVTPENENKFINFIEGVCLLVGPVIFLAVIIAFLASFTGTIELAMKVAK